jgi:hypothetical protein
MIGFDGRLKMENIGGETSSAPLCKEAQIQKLSQTSYII